MTVKEFIDLFARLMNSYDEAKIREIVNKYYPDSRGIFPPDWIKGELNAIHDRITEKRYHIMICEDGKNLTQVTRCSVPAVWEFNSGMDPTLYLCEFHKVIEQNEMQEFYARAARKRDSTPIDANILFAKLELMSVEKLDG